MSRLEEKEVRNIATEMLETGEMRERYKKLLRDYIDMLRKRGLEKR